MIHPTELAEDIIWSRIANCYFSEETQKLLSKLESIQQDLNHRIMQPKSEAAVKFMAALESKIKQFPIPLAEEEMLLAKKKLALEK